MTNSLLFPPQSPAEVDAVLRAGEPPRPGLPKIRLAVLGVAFLGVIVATILHIAFPTGAYSIVTHASEPGIYITGLQAAASNAANAPIAAGALALFIASLLVLVGALFALGAGSMTGTMLSTMLGTVVAIALSFSYMGFGADQHADRTNQLQQQVDRWIAQDLKVPNNYDFLHDTPKLERGYKGTAEVVKTVTEGDFIKSYSTRTSEGKAIKFTISRVGETYTVRVVQPQVR